MRVATLCIVLMLQAATCLADTPVITNLTTTTGGEFRNARFGRLENHNVVIRYATGVTTVPLDTIPDDVCIAWGLPTHEQVAKAEAESREFAAAQHAKGLVCFEGQWGTPAECIVLAHSHRNRQAKGAALAARRQYMIGLEKQRQYHEKLENSLELYLQYAPQRTQLQTHCESLLAEFAKSVADWQEFLLTDKTPATDEQLTEVNKAKTDLKRSTEAMTQRKTALKELEESIQKTVILARQAQQAAEMLAIKKEKNAIEKEKVIAEQRQAVAQEHQAVALNRQAVAQNRQADAQEDQAHAQNRQAVVQERIFRRIEWGF